MLFKATVISRVPAAPLFPVMAPVRLPGAQLVGPPEVVGVDEDGDGEVEVVGDDLLVDVGARVVVGVDEPDEHAANPAPHKTAAANPTVTRLFIHSPLSYLCCGRSVPHRFPLELLIAIRAGAPDRPVGADRIDRRWPCCAARAARAPGNEPR